MSLPITSPAQFAEPAPEEDGHALRLVAALNPHCVVCGHQNPQGLHYITSLKPDAKRLNASIRQHWGIENKLHWVLDIGFGEDLDRKRAGHAAQNFSVLNRIALNLLKQDKTSKRGVQGKKLKAGWDNDYLLHLLKN